MFNKHFYLVISVLWTLLVPDSALSGVSNIKQMSQDYTGYFDVICLDGRSETIRIQAILENIICQNRYGSFNTSAIGSNLGYINSATPKVEISNSTNIIRIETFGAEIGD
jgi:hypothetical protein